jgi:hypothetical protein
VIILAVSLIQHPESQIVAIAWCVAGLAFFATGIRSYVQSRKAHNSLSQDIGVFGIILGLGSLLFYIVPFGTFTDQQAIEIGRIAAAITYASFIVQSRIAWYLFLKGKVAFWWVGLATAAVSAVIFVRDYNTFHLQDTANGLTWVRTDQYSPIIMGFLTLALLVPVGIAILRKGLYGPNEFRKRINALIIGAVYTVIGSVVALSDLFYHSSSTLSEVGVMLLLGVLLLVIVLLPRHATATQPK